MEAYSNGQVKLLSIHLHRVERSSLSKFFYSEQAMSEVPMTSMFSLSVQEISCLVRRSRCYIFLSDHLSIMVGSDEGPWNHSFRFEQSAL
jgi:hypothetical protein